ncbi:MAG: hypothetical protein Q4E59_02910 [Bacteroidales bacterium]|nr:hypothetical protein [Bacteroidales bacterium]
MNETWSPVARDKVVALLLKTLLPPVDNRHRNMANEVNYLSTTMNRLLLQQFGFRIEFQTLMDLLRNAGYVFFTRDGLCDPNKRRLKPIKSPTLFPDEVEMAEPTQGRGGTFVYVNLSGKVVRTLRCLTIPLPPNMSADKLELLNDVKARLEQFKANVPALFEEEPEEG